MARGRLLCLSSPERLRERAAPHPPPRVQPVDLLRDRQAKAGFFKLKGALCLSKTQWRPSMGSTRSGTGSVRGRRQLRETGPRCDGAKRKRSAAPETPS